MTATKTAPKRKKSKLDEAPAKLKVDQCPVCLTEDANIKVYVRADVGVGGNRRVWACHCGHEWPRNVEDTATR